MTFTGIANQMQAENTVPMKDCIITIYALIRCLRRKRDDDGPAMAKREANYVTHVMTGQCVIIKSSISCQECALLHSRLAIGHYANSIMPILLPVTLEKKSD
ncbi:hypothetical protein ALC53_10468 [Atta colombica]|uniref:Uncharacterized protein n=1 Tax=Atta colombica TaxID=520822 RepID=A0A151I0T2_9HYME|nr:hypothetical protein ALC53_10468 [Atta colombica]